jgi:hypothetical protein
MLPIGCQNFRVNFGKLNVISKTINIFAANLLLIVPVLSGESSTIGESRIRMEEYSRA